MLRIHVRKRLGAFGLELEDLNIVSAFTALFGPSGSGKTSTLNLLAGSLTPDTGEIILNDRVLISKEKGISIPPQKRHIGYIFQESRLFPHLSVKENLEFGLKRTPERDRKFSFAEIVDLTRIRDFLTRSPADLSGGERQRVALARALLASPEYLLMDEPLAALDLPTRLYFLKHLKKIHARLHLPILYVSHDISNVLNFADQVVILQNGRNVGYDRPYSLLDKMTAPPLVSYEDVPNIFEVEVQSHEAVKTGTIAATPNLSFILPHLNAVEGERLLLNIPASEIIIARNQPTHISASNIFAGRIVNIYHLSERVLVEVDAQERFTVEIIPATVQRLGLKVGSQLFLIIKASSFRRLG